MMPLLISRGYHSNGESVEFLKQGKAYMKRPSIESVVETEILLMWNNHRSQQH